MSFREDTYCGLYCGACDCFLATKYGELSELARGSRYAPEELACKGCKGLQRNIFCSRCGIRACAEDKEVAFCFECSSFPCEKVKLFRHDEHPHHSIIFANLSAISRSGTNEWLDQQRARWSCTTCGRSFSWYDKSCHKCETELFSCVEEERSLSGQR